MILRTLLCSSLALMGSAAITPTALAQTPPTVSVSRGMTLADALRLAEERSPVIAAAQADVAAAEGRTLQAGLRPNPEASLEFENFGGQRSYSGFDSTETTLALSQRFELGDKRRSRRNAAGALVDTARIRLAVARAEIAKEVRDGFAQAMAARERLVLAEENKERASELSRVASELVDAGREPPLRALRAEADLSGFEAELETARAEYEASRRALAVIWGDADIGELTGELAAEEAPSGAVDPEMSLDVRLAAAELHAAELGARREASAGRPDVTAELGIRRFEEDRSQAAIFGLSIPLPINDRNQGNVAAARSEAVSSAARLARARAEAARQILVAENSRRAADARLLTLERAVSRTAEALGLAKRGYEAGKFSLLDVLDAQEAHSTNQSNLIEARLQRALASSTLLRASAQ